MSTSSTFLHRLSPEIRLIIYAFVFSPSTVVKSSSSNTALGFKKRKDSDCNWPKKHDIPLDTAILTASKLTYTEAIPLFYREKTIRGTTRDFRLLLQNADSLNMFDGSKLQCITCYEDHYFRSILRRLQTLPDLRSLTILSDCLNFLLPDPDPLSFEYFTVLDFCVRVKLGEATCVEIGRYQLHGRFSKIQFAHRRLVLLWPGVVNTPAGCDAFEDFESIRSKWPSQGDSRIFTRWCTQTSLRCWVGLHDAFLAMEISGEVPTNDAKLELLREFVTSMRCSEFNRFSSLRPPVPTIPDDEDLERRFLLRIKPEDGHEILSWATERLAINITTYEGIYNDREKWIITSHWYESDGRISTIEYMLMHQGFARAGLPDVEYLQDPVRPERLYFVKEAGRWIDDTPCRGIASYTSHDKIVKDIEDLITKQLAYLSMALARQDVPVDDEYWADRDAWAADLLRRYILASGPMEAAKTARLQETPLKDLRYIVRDVLLILASDDRSEFLDNWPPMCIYASEDFEEELYEPFAWLYGRLLRYAVLRYVRTDSLDGVWGSERGEVRGMMRGALATVWGKAKGWTRSSSKRRKRSALDDVLS